MTSFITLRVLGATTAAAKMGQLARVNAKKKFCANDVIPLYESYYKRILSES